MDPHTARQSDDPPRAFPPNAFDPVGPQKVVRLGDSGDLAAALPVLVGFRPVESVVLVALGGRSRRRVGLTARADIPPPGQAPGLAGALAARLAQERPDAAVLAVVSEAADVPVLPDDLAGAPAGAVVDLPHRGLVHEVLVALAAHDVPLRETLLVRGGRWWSYDCDQACCRPGAGTPVPGGATPLAAAAVAAGQVIAGDRDELVARIAPSGIAEAAAMAATVVDVGEELADLVLTDGRDAAARVHADRVDAALARCGLSGLGVRLGDGDVARVVWGLRDVRVRDRALGFALGPQAAAAERLWTECTRRAPAPLDAAPATLLAVCAWLRGDGAMARIAIDRALDSEPGYALAGLLSQGLDAGLRPQDLRSMVATTQADLGSPFGMTGCLDGLAEGLRGSPGEAPATAPAPIRAASAAAIPLPARARRGRRTRSRTRPRRSPG
jgi:hypothetical protein